MRPKILLVEDESALQETLKEYLEPTYHVVTANSVEQATESLKYTYFKVILIDLGLPDASGMEIIKLVAKEHKKTVSLVLTGDKSSETVKKAIEADAEDYLVKPVSKQQLHSRIQNALFRRIMPE